MRTFFALLIIALGLGATASGQTCTGLCLQQTTCPSGGTTSITGVVYAPNGTDPLPNVTVYIPNAPVAAFTPGVSCDVVGAPPSGSPLVGATTAVDGSFTLGDVPVGANIPLVIVSGRWRRQLVVPSTTACTNTALPASFAVMPQNQSQGDIPKIAIATGAVDQVECILRKVGIADTEFTDPSSSGRINFFTGSGGAGAVIDAATPTQASLMENASTLNSYDVLMLPCQGTPSNNVVSGTLGTQELANFINFANAGGRVYSSHYSYAWMYNNPPLNGVVNWNVGQTVPNNLTSGTIPATVDTTFTAGQTLAQWLQLEGASTTTGQIGIQTIKHDMDGVIAPTQSWLTLNDALGTDTTPVMQFVFDTPIAAAGSTVNQCGRVLYNEYHVEGGTSSPTTPFPTECSSTTTLNPQEKLLEYMLFELTAGGGQPSMSPTSQSFGSEAVGFTTAPQTFTWTNNSSFPASVTSATVSGNFSIASNNCASVAPGTSCQINVVFTPQSLGALTGTLIVVSSGNSLSASLTGTGTPGFSMSPASLSFGNLDVGASTSQSLVLTSLATGPLAVPPFVISGPFSVNTTACGATVAAFGTCNIAITFHPTTTGQQTGTLSVNSSNLDYNGLSATLTGTGVDFSISLSPTSGTVVAGDSVTTTATLTPIAGFSANVSINCGVATSASATTCGLATATLTPGTTTTAKISINTVSQYTVIGYGGFGGGYLWLVALGTGWLLWAKRRSAGTLLRAGLMAVLLGAVGLSLTGCSGKLPAQNPVYTGPGNYAVTVSATDGFLVRSATYSLTVTSK
jgi:Abnormal spindle-like microcephaly-assoc'd, ASPM-SPD-2-Hydin